MSSTGRDFWGPPLWKTIHTFAATLTPETADSYIKFLYTTASLLPCKECKENFKKLLKQYPPAQYITNNNNDAFFYSYLLHDVKNRSLGKKSPPFDDVKSYYFRSLGDECENCKV
ncbi:Erv1/Alr family FAD-linked sulfhydryl oxidase [bacterium]|nr:Erv1/Alr family FAD-linked sulfhydryl oxidase [bacterium]